MALAHEVTVGDDRMSDGDTTTQEKEAEDNTPQPFWTLGLSPP